MSTFKEQMDAAEAFVRDNLQYLCQERVSLAKGDPTGPLLKHLTKLVPLGGIPAFTLAQSLVEHAAVEWVARRG